MNQPKYKEKCLSLPLDFTPCLKRPLNFATIVNCKFPLDFPLRLRRFDKEEEDSDRVKVNALYVSYMLWL